MKKNEEILPIQEIDLKKIFRIMKLTFTLFFLGIFSLYGEVYSQDTRISVNIENGDMNDLFNIIEKQSEFKIFYKSSLIQVTDKITLHAESVLISDALVMAFKDKNLSFELVNKVYVITSKSPALKPKKITGRVTDESGNTVPGVSVVIEGTQTGTVTDVNGIFSIEVPNEDAILLFSFVGYNPQKVPVKGLLTIDVKLFFVSQSLDEVVIVGYATTKAVSVTGAIAAIGSKELLRSPTASVANSLSGRVTGFATVQYGGQPGAENPLILVRGIGSLTAANSTPLILVDGVERSFTQMDPNEIESVSILKDASATAVYGVRGANGVVLVTTRRGVSGPPKITFSISGGVQQPTRLLDFTGSYEYAKIYNEAQLNDDPNAILKFNAKAIEAFRTNSDPILYPNMDWMKFMLKPASFMNQENLNISGGTNKIKYFVSLGYLKQNGIFKKLQQYDNRYSFDRFNYRTNLDIDVTKTTKLAISIGSRAEIRNEPFTPNISSWGGEGEVFRRMYWAQPYSSSGFVDGKWVKVGDHMPGQIKTGIDDDGGFGIWNIARNILNFDVSVNQKLDVVTKGLEFRLKGAYNSTYEQKKERIATIARYMSEPKSMFDPTAPDSNTVVYRKDIAAGTLSYNESYSKARNWYLEGGLSYNRQFGLHTFTGLLLYNESKTFYPDVYTDISHGFVGLAGRVTYDYNTRYLLDINLGYNGSENFAPGKRFGFFPAISAAWIITNEKFMKNIHIFDYLKIRASYGTVGNDNVQGLRFLYNSDSYLANTGGYNFGTSVPSNQITAGEGTLGNPNVTWEKAIKQNYGIDMKFFKEKLNLSFDYFTENRSNILTTRQTVPGYIPVTLPALNIGQVENKGYEVSAGWRDNISKDFSYFTIFNLSFVRNKVLFKDEIEKREPYLMETGQPVGQMFGYIWDGFWSEADVTNLSAFPKHLFDPKPGDMRYKDLNNDNIINEYDQKPIGYPEYPEYVAGFTIGFSYKRFDFSMLWTAATHTSRLLDENFSYAFGISGDRSLLQWIADGRWTPENAANAKYPRMTLKGNSDGGYNMKVSDFWMRDASYLRLKNAELGYNIMGLKKIGISNLRIYINGYDLITIDKLKLTDPESKTDRKPLYPIIKIYNIGLRVTF